MSPVRAEVGSLIVDLIRERLGLDVEGPDTDLLDSGLLDSLALVMLIAALEESFACELPLDDFDLEHFRSARRMTEFLGSSGVLESRFP
jgi:D-alanine--poly(phosphoribitol) ligase subunit 2